MPGVTQQKQRRLLIYRRFTVALLLQQLYLGPNDNYYYDQTDGISFFNRRKLCLRLVLIRLVSKNLSNKVSVPTYARVLVPEKSTVSPWKPGISAPTGLWLTKGLLWRSVSLRWRGFLVKRQRAGIKVPLGNQTKIGSQGTAHRVITSWAQTTRTTCVSLSAAFPAPHQVPGT